MLTDLKPQAEDKILALMALYRDDPRKDKIDLGVGVYKDATGLTPVMRAVKAAERRLLEGQTTKTYTTLAGDPAFAREMEGLILGPDVSPDRLSAIATPGGTGALRQALELIRMANPSGKVWLSDPTWPNHVSMVRHMGIETVAYRYFDTETRGVDFDAMIADLARSQAGDAVLLHGCCHNPTGANLTLPQWAEVAAVLEKTGATPFIDLAYQGFGDGLEADAAGTRLIARRLPETLIAASCSKNFGLYRDRAGLLIAVSNPAHRGIVQANLAYLNRQNYSFPPDHGAACVTTILSDADLRADWSQELEAIRANMLALREALAAALQARAGSDRFAFLGTHRGMFSRLGATPDQVAALRRDHGIYLVGDSRMNIAGLNARTVPILADAIIAVGV